MAGLSDEYYYDLIINLLVFLKLSPFANYLLINSVNLMQCNYLVNFSLIHNSERSTLMLWVWTSLRRGVLDTTLCDKVCQWLAADRWFSPGTSVSSTNKTDRHDITEILLKVVLNTIALTQEGQTWELSLEWVHDKKANLNYIKIEL